jgi:hypothetical protein
MARRSVTNDENQRAGRKSAPLREAFLSLFINIFGKKGNS